MNERFAPVLDRITRVPGVHAALVVDTVAGVPVAVESGTGISEAAIAALSASLQQRAEAAVGASGYGGVRLFHLEAERGHVLAAAAGDLMVLAMADGTAHLGAIRLELQRASEELV